MMHFKKKLGSVAAVVLAAVSALYGGTLEIKSIEEEVPIFSRYGDKETIYFWYSDDALTNYVNSAAVSFGEEKGVRVIPVQTSDSAYLEAINKASTRSEQTADVFIISNDSLEKAYLAGLAGEVTDPHGICNETYFPDSALEAVSYKGKKIAYPLYYETSVLVYNETYLQEWSRQQAEREQAEMNAEGSSEEDALLDEELAGQRTEELMAGALPDTIDDILTIADTFDAPDGVDGVMTWDVSDIFYNYWIVGNYMIVGGDAGDDVNNMNIDNPETIACLEVYKALHQFFFIESDTVNYESVLQDFIDGKTMFTIVTSDAIERLRAAREAEEFTFDYGFTTMPAVSEEYASRSLSVTGTVAVNDFSEHKELANEFASYLATEYADELYERTGKLSANREACSEDGPDLVFLQEYAKSVPLPKMMETGNFWMQLEVLFSKVWNNADVTALVKELAASF